MPLLLQVLPLLAGCSAAPRPRPSRSKTPSRPCPTTCAPPAPSPTGSRRSPRSPPARAEFESQVEPRLRLSRDPLDVAATEYGFARVHRALADGGDAGTEIEILVRRLQPKRGR
jgi:hypothetical protein